MWIYLGLFRDAAMSRLYELWSRFDSRPPAPSAFALARRYFAEDFIARTIMQRAELGPEGLDALRSDLVGYLRRRALWEGEDL